MVKNSIEVHQESTAQKIEVPSLVPYEEPRLDPGATGVHPEPGKTLYGNSLDVQEEAQDRASQPNTAPGDERQAAASALTSEALRLAVGANELLEHDVPEQDDLGYMPPAYQPGKDLPQRQ